MPSVLFVCTANRFRSPLSEAAFRFELEKSGQPGTWTVGSAGTWTLDGLPPVPEAIQAASELGLDVGTHTSRLINANLIKEYTLILVMQSGQKEALIAEFPYIINKVYLLTEAMGKVPYDIPDPFVTGESPQQITRELVGLIQSDWKQICQLAERLEGKE